MLIVGSADAHLRLLHTGTVNIAGKDRSLEMMDSLQQVTVGIDLGGTSLRVALYGPGMCLIASKTVPTRVLAGPDACVRDMVGCIDTLLHGRSRIASREQVLGLGIGSPGPINLRTGVLGLLPNLSGWENFPLRDALSTATGLQVTLESDANAAALAEWTLGAGKEAGLDSMAMITLGTGVGSGLILKRRVWHGVLGMGGEVGHATVAPDGLLCNCGSCGCLEMYASASGLLRLARSIASSAHGTRALAILIDNPDCTTREVATLAQRERDSGALLAFEQLGEYLGRGIANLINTLDLPMIVIGGGLADAWGLFAPAMFRTVRDYSLVYRLAMPSQLETMETDRTFIRPALLGSSAGLLGAGLLPRLNAPHLPA